MNVSACPALAATLPTDTPGASHCTLCGGYLEPSLAPHTPSPWRGEVVNRLVVAPLDSPATAGGLLLRRTAESTERAFTLSVPMAGSSVAASSALT